MSRRKKLNLKRIIGLLYYLVISFVCLVAFILLYYVISSQIHSNDENYHPRISIYTIVSPSMTPVINVYDVVVNVRVSNPAKIKVGDIITYVSSSSTSEGMTITHRVIEIKKDENGNYEYLTQGDNNSNPDSLYVTFDKIIGKEILIIPKLGKVQFLIANKRTWLYILLIPIFIFILRDLYKLVDLLTLKKKVDIITTEEPEEEINHKKQKELKEQLLESKLEDLEETTQIDFNKTIKPTVINEKIEILDTDELTSKIKLYDEKIEELNRAIEEYNQEKVEEIIEEDNFLVGRLKVISTVDTKNKKRINKNIYKVDETKEVKKEKPKVVVEKKEEQPVERIKEVKNNISTKPRLDLNPKKINKVSKKVKAKPRLNLNPNEVKEINRPGRQRIRSRKRTKAIQQQKQRLIEIRKTK